MNSFFVSVLLSVVVVKVSCYKTLSALDAIIFTDIPYSSGKIHSEYFFGKCALGINRIIIAEDHILYKDIKNIAVVRGLFSNFDLAPNCVVIKATSSLGDMVKYNRYKFNICFIKIIYWYHYTEFRSQYYEWYIPVEMHPEIVWHLYFYRTS